MVYDYYLFGMLMPGHSPDTAGLCLTSTRYYVPQEMHYASAGTLGTEELVVEVLMVRTPYPTLAVMA